jgi:hypothetical protein
VIVAGLNNFTFQGTGVSLGGVAPLALQVAPFDILYYCRTILFCQETKWPL